MASGQGQNRTHISCIARHYHVCVNVTHTHYTGINTFDSLFHSFITLCENDYFFMPDLHYSLTTAALCVLDILPSFSLKNIFMSISSHSLKTYIYSPLCILVSSVVKLLLHLNSHYLLHLNSHYHERADNRNVRKQQITSYSVKVCWSGSSARAWKCDHYK